MKILFLPGGRHKTDESLMTDRLNSEWFPRLIGQDGNLPDESLRKVTKLLLRTNSDKAQKLLNAAEPQGNLNSRDTSVE